MGHNKRQGHGKQGKGHWQEVAGQVPEGPLTAGAGRISPACLGRQGWAGTALGLYWAHCTHLALDSPTKQHHSSCCQLQQSLNDWKPYFFTTCDSCHHPVCKGGTYPKVPNSGGFCGGLLSYTHSPIGHWSFCDSYLKVNKACIQWD